MSSVTPEPLFAVGAPLPRGPHGLPREDVEASQRMRLLAAVTELVGEHGYGAVTLGQLVTRAGVSRATFYAHFADKEACYLAAYDHFAQALVANVLGALEADQSWATFVDRALGAYIDTLRREPAVARAFIVEMEAAGATARHKRREAMDGFAALIAQRHAAMREQIPALGPLPARAYLGIAVGVRELVREELDDPSGKGSEPDFDALHRDIVAWVTAAILGAGRTTDV